MGKASTGVGRKSEHMMLAICIRMQICCHAALPAYHPLLRAAGSISRLVTAMLLLSLWTSPVMSAPPLTIAAASSLRHAMDEIIGAWQTTWPDKEIRVIYGSSGKMTTQIRNGAPYDMFFAADMDLPLSLHEAGLSTAPPQAYALGRLVLAWRTGDSPLPDLHGLTGASIRRVAIAQPRHAPYGQRAREALMATGLWEQLAPKLVFGENIAQAGQMIAAGGADAGIIALSLVRASGPSRFGHTLIDDSLHKPLAQGFVITSRAIDKTLAREFADFLGTQTARSILQDYGFATPRSPDNLNKPGH